MVAMLRVLMGMFLVIMFLVIVPVLVSFMVLLVGMFRVRVIRGALRYNGGQGRRTNQPNEQVRVSII
jgi:hypothetical protein